MDYLTLKRLFDMVIATAALLVLAPFLLLIALLIRFDSPGPALFFQERIGQHGRCFRIVKFRSMVQNAPALGPSSTAAGDPRITRAGRFIRTTSIDELPQLINILMGDMSLIGPRPCLPSHEPLYTPEQWQVRHRVRPGLTGLAQVSGRSELSHEAQLGYDLDYAQNPSIKSDLCILLKTVLIVWRRSGTN